MTSRLFLLSPARCDGARTSLVLREDAGFPIALQLRSSNGAPLGDVFSFLSGLYFRGKLAYARAFGISSPQAPPALIITSDRGLMLPDDRIRREDVVAFAGVDIGAGGPRFTEPLRRDVTRLAESIDANAVVVLLGSIASNKYVDVLVDALGNRLVFPLAFVGRGDMSRGGLLLRCADEGRELEYAPVAGAIRHGKRPPKLDPKR